VHPSAQGTLHDAAALIAFRLFGPSRSAALALNMLALLGWQLTLFVAVARRSESRALAFAAALLPLALAGPWENIPGSAYDFRLDHFAMCALGVSASLALLTDGFRARRASLGFGVAVGITLLTRFLTGTYFVVIFAALLIWILVADDRRTRLANLGWAALTAAIIAGPIFWICRDRVLDYYWIGHFVGPESAIRDAHMGVRASVSFVFGQLGQRHLGIFFGVIAAAGTLAFASLRGERRSVPRGMWIVGMIFLFAPALVLALHRQKSDVVLSALAPGAVLLAVALWLQFGRAAGREKTSWFAAGAIACGALAFFTQRQLRPAFDPATLREIGKVNALADALYARVKAAPFAEPNIAVDYITDCLDAEVLRVIFYERHGAWLPIRMTLPTGVAEPTTSETMERLARSHFVFLTEEAPPGLYPYDRKLAELRPQLRAWCEEHLRLVERFELFGRRMALYQHREIPLAPVRP
jgi:hypothetical protein